MMTNLITDEDLEKEVLPIDTSRIMEVLEMDDLLDRINYFKDILPKANKGYKGKFNKLKDMIIKDGYDVRNFSRDLPLFMDSFHDNVEMVIRFHEESTEAIFDRFMLIANSLIVNKLYVTTHYN